MVDAFARLGQKFYCQVDEAVGHLLLFPEMARIYSGRFRRLILTGTPFGLFYCIEPNRLVIAALLDLRQSPGKIRSRLGL